MKSRKTLLALMGVLVLMVGAGFAELYIEWTREPTLTPLTTEAIEAARQHARDIHDRIDAYHIERAEEELKSGELGEAAQRARFILEGHPSSPSAPRAREILTQLEQDILAR